MFTKKNFNKWLLLSILAFYSCSASKFYFNKRVSYDEGLLIKKDVCKISTLSNTNLFNDTISNSELCKDSSNEKNKYFISIYSNKINSNNQQCISNKTTNSNNFTLVKSCINNSKKPIYKIYKLTQSRLKPFLAILTFLLIVTGFILAIYFSGTIIYASGIRILIKHLLFFLSCLLFSAISSFLIYFWSKLFFKEKTKN